MLHIHVQVQDEVCLSVSNPPFLPSIGGSLLLSFSSKSLLIRLYLVLYSIDAIGRDFVGGFIEADICHSFLKIQSVRGIPNG
jgi:hypothetical protein